MISLVFLVVAAILVAAIASARLWRTKSQSHGQDASADKAILEKLACPMSAVRPSTAGVWDTNEPLKLRAFKPVYHITMATRNVDPSELIIMDRNYKDNVLERRALIAKHPKTVIGVTPAGEDAVAELYEYLLRDYLPQRFPTMFALSSDGKTLHNLVTEIEWPTRSPASTEEALTTLGETVEDDLFLLKETERGHLNVAHVCCYPSGFNPAEKLDKVLEEIHAPVPHYDKIGPSMERTFSRLKVGKALQRSNWAIVDSPTRFNTGSNHIRVDKVEEVETDQDLDVRKIRFRCELQTLIRLPDTKAVLFSFKTHMYTLDEIKKEGLGQELADAIDGLKYGNAPSMWVYKGAIRWAKATQAYLMA